MPSRKGARYSERSPQPFTCKECGVTFYATRGDATWCGPTCRQRSYRARRAVRPKVSALQASLARASEAARQFLEREESTR